MLLQILSDPHNNRLQDHYLIIQTSVREHFMPLIISKMATLNPPYRQGQLRTNVHSSKYQHLQRFLPSIRLSLVAMEVSTILHLFTKIISTINLEWLRTLSWATIAKTAVEASIHRITTPQAQGPYWSRSKSKRDSKLDTLLIIV
jgi:hypothetical protein